jgi:SpoVK/Ycf46/Vps4 family AAA+-type ATPase
MEYLWFITNDAEKLRKGIEKGYKVCPEKEEVLKWLREGERFNVVSTVPPPKELKGFFISIDLDRDIFTSQERKVLSRKPELEKELLKRKFGINLMQSSVTLKDLEGMDKLNDFVSSVRAFDFGSLFYPKSVFLVGVPGTGKSFSMKAVAGELGYYITEISLVELLEKAEPVTTLEKILNFLEEKQIKTLVWVDEVEKAFSNPKFGELMQKLLTVLQEWNETKYFVKGFWWWTANDLKLVKEKYPEFLRSERHDYLWFVDYPKQSDARKIAELYAKKFFLAPWEKVRTDKRLYEKVNSQAKENLEKLLDSFIDFASGKTTTYQAEGLIDADRIPFTPAEIKSFMKLIAKWSYMEGELFLNEWEKAITFINPVIDIARDKIQFLRSQRDIFKPLN